MPFPKYLEKIKNADIVIADTKEVLHSHRNLAEDFCTIKAIEVEDIGICTDMEVEPSADIEAILAEAYYRIDQYMSPDIKFYSLQQCFALTIRSLLLFLAKKLISEFIVILY